MSSRSSSLTPSTSSSDTGEIDMTRLDNVYQALMSTILDVPAYSISPQVVVDGTTNHGSVDEGEANTDGGAVKNAKRRKMDKKRAKREEQKLAQEESVDAVGTFFSFSHLQSPSLLHHIPERLLPLLKPSLFTTLSGNTPSVLPRLVENASGSAFHGAVGHSLSLTLLCLPLDLLLTP
jgi:hypothetical protein